ncbi:uncharacterized protein LOC109119876 precursor [Solanum lycopersicum]|uniref:Uncharacterized protein n=1 Tax=Solanum lycopersicum TaxID=4081 RepID=A0A3Q7GI69_SOLLC|nr:uncharacterized protein LOC109119876 precursor [Solanum lycopersicum]
MKVAFFPCLVILLCALAVTSRSSETSHTLKIRGVHVSKHLACALERNSKRVVADTSGDTNKFEDVISDVEKNQRGRGANGGGSIARQPRTLDKNSAVMLKQPSISLSTICVMSSLPLLLVLPFVIP